MSGAKFFFSTKQAEYLGTEEYKNMGWTEISALTPTGVEPCACGNTDLIIWPHKPPREENMMGLESLEKIECGECGRTVWGCEREQVEQWNRQDYDDGPGSAVEGE